MSGDLCATGGILVPVLIFIMCGLQWMTEILKIEQLNDSTVQQTKKKVQAIAFFPCLYLIEGNWVGVINAQRWVMLSDILIPC